MSGDLQIKSIYERWERLEGEKKAISDDLKELFAESKLAGYDGKALRIAFNRKAKMDAATTADEHFDAVVDTYLDALNGSPRDARLRTREKIEEFDPITGEFVSGEQVQQSPRKAAEAVAEMPRNNPEAKASVDNAATIAPETATAGREMRVGSAPSGSVPATSEGGRDSVERHAPISPETAAGETGMVLGTGKERPLSIGLHTDGDPEARFETVSLHQNNEYPSIDSAEPGILAEDTRSDANTGGEDVDLNQNAAHIEAGTLVSENVPATPMHRNMFAHCWPDLTKREYEELEDSISVIGIQEPIVRKGDIILDGWNRYNIARSLDENYPVIEYDGSDELLDVIRWQRSSRDCTPQQEAKIAKALAAEVPARAEEIFAAFHIVELPDGEIVCA